VFLVRSAPRTRRFFWGTGIPDRVRTAQRPRVSHLSIINSFHLFNSSNTFKMANHIYNISETRSLPALIDTSSIVNLMHNHLVSRGWRVKDVAQTSLRATKQGLHVNFKPKVSVTVQHDLANNRTLIQIRALASIKIVTCVFGFPCFDFCFFRIFSVAQQIF
jgi:hypothetical protein